MVDSHSSFYQRPEDVSDPGDMASDDVGFDPNFDDDGEDRDRLLLPIDQILLTDDQPRKHFNPRPMTQLTQSVRIHGIIEPILVRPVEDDLYELVAGERRYRAAQAAGLTEVPVVIRELSREEAMELALVENLQREDLNVVEETEGIVLLLSLRLQCSAEDVPPLLHRLAKFSDNVVGTSGEIIINHIQDVFDGLGTMTWKSFATHRLPLLNLPIHILEALRAGQIAYTKARAIAKVKETQQQEALLQDAIADKLSLRDIKTRIASLETEPFTSLRETAPETPPPPPSLEQRCARLTQRFRRKKQWRDSHRKRAERLLSELESLLDSETESIESDAQ
jgi:ParB family chromosome partitioning protein